MTKQEEIRHRLMWIEMLLRGQVDKSSAFLQTHRAFLLKDLLEVQLAEFDRCS